MDSTSSEQHRRRPRPLRRRSSIDCMNKLNNLLIKPSDEHDMNTQIYDTMTSVSRYHSNPKRVYDIPITIERPRKCLIPPIEQQYQGESCDVDEDEDTIYDNVSKSDGIGKFRFVVPFNHSPRSAFTSIKPINSPSSSSSSIISANSTMPQTSLSSNNSNTNNNNSKHRTRLMTAV